MSRKIIQFKDLFKNEYEFEMQESYPKEEEEMYLKLNDKVYQAVNYFTFHNGSISEDYYHKFSELIYNVLDNEKLANIHFPFGDVLIVYKGKVTEKEKKVLTNTLKLKVA